MLPYISNDLKGRIPALHYEQGYNIKKICQLLGIKKTLTSETLKNHWEFGVPYDPHARRRGLRPHCLTTIDLSFIWALLNQQHTVYLDEIQEQLLMRCGVKVSIPTLTRTLHQLLFTNKDVASKALERNDHDHAVYMNCIAELVPDLEMLMFGDEASKDERMSNRRRGWSCQGTRCVQRKCFVRGKRFLILPIITLDGIIAHNIIEGLVTTEKFVKFLRELVVCVKIALVYLQLIWSLDPTHQSIPRASQHPHPWQLLHSSCQRNPAACWGWHTYVNASISHSFLNIYTYGATECKLIFLPPYLPDYNPIEQAFSSIKAFLRQNWQDKSLSVIDRACHNITPEKAVGYFKASGYIV